MPNQNHDSARRQFLKNITSGIALAGASTLIPDIAFGKKTIHQPADLPPGTLSSSVLDIIEGKKPLIKRSYRPVNYETPLEYFKHDYTPNDVFFVRWHSPITPKVTAEEWRLKISGDALEKPQDKPYEITFQQLKNDFEAVELAAVCQCSGNRRGLSSPHVAGVQWGYGAMGNALWKGARLKDILNKFGIKKETLEVYLNGADLPAMSSAPDFQKSLPAWKALDENTILAYEMNGQPLPFHNGFPVRLVVPGWTAAYWIKQLTEVTVSSKPMSNFWMAPAYRIPKGKFPVVDRFTSQETADTTPITEMVVNSLITSVIEGEKFKFGKTIEVKGIAWDGGYGINLVEVSMDGGKTWSKTELDKDLGRFSWRQWKFKFTPKSRGKHQILSKATNKIGGTQTFELNFNPSGYHNNVVHLVNFNVV